MVRRPKFMKCEKVLCDMHKMFYLHKLLYKLGFIHLNNVIKNFQLLV